MKIHLKTFCTMLFCLTLLPAGAQPGPKQAGDRTGSDGPTIGNPSSKLFGSNVSYSATMEMQTDKAKPILTKVFADHGKLRHEIDMAENIGSQLPPEITAQLRSSGMGKQILLWLPEKNGFYQIQPAVQGYLELPMPSGKTLTESDYQMETMQLGKETLDGHPCVKNKAVVTDPQGRKNEFIVWNATDLNNFPIKIQTTTSLRESQITLYRNIKLAKPDPNLFDLPAGYRKYPDIGTMMQDIMMKQLSGGMGR